MSELPDNDTEPELSALGWYSRGYLPHFDSYQTLQFITFRLADSLPREKLAQLEQELAMLGDRPETALEMTKRRRIEQWLDTGMGCCALGHPKMGQIMQDTLIRFDGVRYALLAWCVMPNHVHVLIDQKETISKIVQSWKSYTGRWALRKNAELGLGVPGGKLWMRDYWDRYIRDQQHFEQVIDYIHRNPVKAGLCSKPEDWLWSSAGSAEPQLGNNSRWEKTT